MAFFARLKKEVNGKKIETGVMIGKKILYPEDPRWIRYNDDFKAVVQADERVEILEDQKAFVEYATKEDEDIETYVRGHWKATQKKVESETDQYFLKKALAKAKELNKETIVQCIEERLEYLNKPQY